MIHWDWVLTSIVAGVLTVVLSAFALVCGLELWDKADSALYRAKLRRDDEAHQRWFRAKPR